MQGLFSFPEEWAAGTIGLSTGRMTTEAEIDRAIFLLVEVTEFLRCEQ
jgi:cysteine sulfinate desulfinase/cysteine desulfurase-like protein